MTTLKDEWYVVNKSFKLTVCEIEILRDFLYIGVGAAQVGPVLTGPLFRKKLVGVTIITINTCVLVHAAAACSTSG